MQNANTQYPNWESPKIVVTEEMEKGESNPMRFSQLISSWLLVIMVGYFIVILCFILLIKLAHCIVSPLLFNSSFLPKLLSMFTISSHVTHD